MLTFEPEVCQVKNTTIKEILRHRTSKNNSVKHVNLGETGSKAGSVKTGVVWLIFEELAKV